MTFIWFLSTYLFSSNQRAVSLLLLNHRVIYLVSGLGLHLLHLFIHYVHMCMWHTFVDQRTIYSSQFSFHYTMWDLGIKIKCEAWQQVPLPAVPFCQPSLKIRCHKASLPNPGPSFSLRNLRTLKVDTEIVKSVADR